MFIRPESNQQYPDRSFTVKYRKQTSRFLQTPKGLQNDDALATTPRLKIRLAAKPTPVATLRSRSHFAVAETLDGLVKATAQMEPPETSCSTIEGASTIKQSAIDALCAPLRKVIDAARERTARPSLMTGSTATSLIALTSLAFAAHAGNPLTPSYHQWHAPRGYISPVPGALQLGEERNPLSPAHDFGRYSGGKAVLTMPSRDLSSREQTHPLHPGFSRSKAAG